VRSGPMDSFLAFRPREREHGAGRSDKEENEVPVEQVALDTMSEAGEEGPGAREGQGEGRSGGEAVASGGEDNLMDVEESDEYTNEEESEEEVPNM
jgi:hypothetical protein